MYLLAIETTGAFASVALLEDDCVLEHIQGHDRFSHLQNLMPQVKEVLENHKLSINDVSAIAVSKGPGSFTGIRIGVSSTRALCQVLGVPGVPVSSLEALAMRVADLPGEVQAIHLTTGHGSARSWMQEEARCTVEDMYCKTVTR